MLSKRMLEEYFDFYSDFWKMIMKIGSQLDPDKLESTVGQLCSKHKNLPMAKELRNPILLAMRRLSREGKQKGYVSIPVEELTPYYLLLNDTWKLFLHNSDSEGKQDPDAYIDGIMEQAKKIKKRNKDITMSSVLVLSVVEDLFKLNFQIEDRDRRPERSKRKR